MNIETKHILALILFVAFGSAGFFLTLVSQRMRDIALFGLTFGAVLIERMNVTFLGEYWYRGTSRGFELSAIDIVPLCLIVATVLLPRYERGRFYWPAGLGFMIAYFAFCCVNVANASPQLYGGWELAKMARGILVLVGAALFIRGRRELQVVVLALCCAVLLEGGNALEQRLFKGVFRPPGTLDHENTLSTYVCMVAPVLVAATMANWSKWLRWFAGLSLIAAVGTEFLTLSRMGIPVFAVVTIGTALMCTSWRITKRKVAIVCTIGAAVAVLLGYSWNGLKARFAQSNIEEELTSSHAVETRGVYWHIAFTIIDDHPRGVGLNNWSYYVSKTYGPELGYAYTDYDDIKWTPTKDEARETVLAPAADSLPALTIGEIGIGGLVVFLLVWLRWLQMGVTFLRRRLNADPMHRLGIGFLFGAIGIFLQSATEWTYKQTAVMFTCHVMMGALASLYYARRHAKAPETAQAPVEDIEVDVLPLAVSRAAK